MKYIRINNSNKIHIAFGLHDTNCGLKIPYNVKSNTPIYAVNKNDLCKNCTKVYWYPNAI
jgi:hypothetical protein